MPTVAILLMITTVAVIDIAKSTLLRLSVFRIAIVLILLIVRIALVIVTTVS